MAADAVIIQDQSIRILVHSQLLVHAGRLTDRENIIYKLFN